MTTKTEKELTEQLKTAMRNRDKVALAAIRMVRTRIMERRTAKNAGELTDEMVVGVIRSYVKSLQSALADFRGAGTPDSDDNVAQMLAEIELLGPYLPTLLDEAGTEALVAKVLDDHDIDNPKMTGRAIGLVMKDHKGTVDPALVSRLVRSRLQG